MTVLDQLKRSLRIIRQLAPGRAPGPSETADAIVVLNAMLDQANTSPLKRYNTRIDAFDLEAGKYVYTLGPGGDWDIPRPVTITKASRIQLGTSPIHTPIAVWGEDDWQNIRLQEVASATIPLGIYPDGAIPVQNVHVWPGAGPGYQIELYSGQQIAAFSATSDTIVAPQGYLEWMAYEWAKRLATEWGKEWRPECEQLLREARASIKASKTAAPRLVNDAPALRPSSSTTFNYRTGQ